MISNNRLYHIHKRLCEIFGVSLDKLFAGLLVIAIGDFYQLPPIRQSSVFTPFKHDLLNFCHPWKRFEYFELTETMRQQGDDQFISLLNNIRVAKCTSDNLALLKSRSVEQK